MTTFTEEQLGEIESVVAEQIADYRAHDYRKDRRTWYALVVILAVSLALNGVMYFVVVHTSRKICGIVVSLDRAYSQNPPTTPLGQQIAEQMHRYRDSLGCG